MAGNPLERSVSDVVVDVEDDSIEGTNLNLALILTNETPQVVIAERTKEYFSDAEVAVDWGSTSKVYKASVRHFQQTPHNDRIKVGVQVVQGSLQDDVAVSTVSEVATVTNVTHGLSVGQEVTVSDSSLSPTLNGVKVIATVPTADTFTFPAAGVADLGPGTLDYHTGDASITAALDAIRGSDQKWFQLFSIYKGKADVKEIAAWTQGKTLKYSVSVEDVDIVNFISTNLFKELNDLNYSRTSGHWYHQSGVDATGVAIAVSPTIAGGDINTLDEVATLSNALNHGLAAGDKVTVSGADTSALNGVKTILSTPSANSFTFAAVGVGDGADANNGAISYVNDDSEKATVTKALHGLRVDDNLTVSGATPSLLNGNKVVLQVLDENRFTYAAPGVVDGAATGTINYFARYEFHEVAIDGLLLGSTEGATIGIGSQSWANKQVVGSVATPDDILSPTQALQINELYNGNVYKELKGFAQTVGGKTFSGRTIKVQTVADWLEARLQEAVLQLFISVDQLLYTNQDIAKIKNVQGVPINTQLTRGGVTPLNENVNYEITYPLASEVPQADKLNNVLKGTAKVRAGTEILSIDLTVTMVI